MAASEKSRRNRENETPAKKGRIQQKVISAAPTHEGIYALTKIAQKLALIAEMKRKPGETSLRNRPGS